MSNIYFIVYNYVYAITVYIEIIIFTIIASLTKFNKIVQCTAYISKLI